MKGGSLEETIIVCVDVSNVSDNSQLRSTGEGKLDSCTYFTLALLECSFNYLIQVIVRDIWEEIFKHISSFCVYGYLGNRVSFCGTGIIPRAVEGHCFPG
jgi:hypothetical protein